MRLDLLLDRLPWMVMGALAGSGALALLRAPRQVRNARVAMVRAANDWQLNREFHLRRMWAALARIDEDSPKADVLREHVTDAYVDEADAMRLKHLRDQQDLYDGLHLAARIWWRISLLWSNRVFEREQALDREAKEIREHFEELGVSGSPLRATNDAWKKRVSRVVESGASVRE